MVKAILLAVFAVAIVTADRNFPTPVDKVVTAAKFVQTTVSGFFPKQ